jgi:hypothetical protein
MNKIIVKDKQDLLKMIKNEIKLYGNACNLNHIDVSNIQDMSYLFMDSQFNGDISKWNVSNANYMRFMFCHSKFNGDISQWDVTNVKDMYATFHQSQFKLDLSDWTPYKANIGDMFEDLPQSVIPYWVHYENLDERKLAIDNYIEKKILSEKLSISLDSKIAINRNKL